MGGTELPTDEQAKMIITDACSAGGYTNIRVEMQIEEGDDGDEVLQVQE